MKILFSTLLLAGLCAAVAGAASDPTSGLPVPPGFSRTGDKTHTFTYCGKQATSNAYVGDDSSPNDVAAWYAKTVPGGRFVPASRGLTTYFVPSGKAAVYVAGYAIVVFRYNPGLSASEMKKRGTFPMRETCT